METADKRISELIKLLEQKLLMFNEIMKLIQEEKNDIEENAGSNISSILDKKQLMMNGIDEIDKAFVEAFDMLKLELKVKNLEEADIAKYPLLKDLRLKVSEITAMAKEMMELEEVNRNKLNTAMDGLKSEIKLINIGKRSIKAYEKPIPYNDGIYIDKKK